MFIILKNQKNLYKKYCKSIFSETVEKVHDTIQQLKKVVHYLNIKIKGKPVEIIDPWESNLGPITYGTAGRWNAQGD